ncbi:MAG: hypothetical protein P1U44_03360 [Vicingaceae bacterium]|nr:hypothetical protein [Flavobacteriales bacterium]MDF1674731.1 hypothetical protein [Vicingaceae bacterium]
MRELKEKQTSFSETNWEIATSIVGAILLMEINPSELNYKKFQREIIEDVFFINLLEQGHDKVKSGTCTPDEEEFYNGLAYSITIIQLMNRYTDYIVTNKIDITNMPELDDPMNEEELESIVGSDSANREASLLGLSTANNLAKDLMNNKDINDIIVRVHNVLCSKDSQKKKELNMIKILVEIRFVDLSNICS